MNELEKKNVKNMIYEIRGKQVMLDSDLAKLYGCKNGTKSINLAVKRNIDRFPDDFYFQLSENEFNNLKFHFETSSWNDYGGIRKLPYVFTEQGVAMLSSVLKTENAAYVSIQIMRAFVAMRHYINSSLIEQKYINNLVFKHEKDIKLLQNTFNGFKQKNNHIFFEGQIYDAYSLLLDILNTSKTTIIIIDNYANKNLFDLLSKTSKAIIVYSKNVNEELINKYQMQYNNVTVKFNNSFHDRFIIIDNDYLYHSGASFKELGKKCFAITKIEDKDIINKLLENLLIKS